MEQIAGSLERAGQQKEERQDKSHRKQKQDKIKEPQFECRADLVTGNLPFHAFPPLSPGNKLPRQDAGPAGAGHH